MTVKPVQYTAVSRQQIAIVLDAALPLDGGEAQVAQLAHHRAHQAQQQAPGDVQLHLRHQEEDDAEDDHAQHTAQQAAHRALHGFLGADGRGQALTQFKPFSGCG